MHGHCRRRALLRHRRPDFARHKWPILDEPSQTVESPANQIENHLGRNRTVVGRHAVFHLGVQRVGDRHRWLAGIPSLHARRNRSSASGIPGRRCKPSRNVTDATRASAARFILQRLFRSLRGCTPAAMPSYRTGSAFKSAPMQQSDPPEQADLANDRRLGASVCRAVVR